MINEKLMTKWIEAMKKEIFIHHYCDGCNKPLGFRYKKNKFWICSTCDCDSETKNPFWVPIDEGELLECYLHDPSWIIKIMLFIQKTNDQGESK